MTLPCVWLSSFRALIEVKAAPANMQYNSFARSSAPSQQTPCSMFLFIPKGALRNEGDPTVSVVATPITSRARPAEPAGNRTARVPHNKQWAGRSKTEKQGSASSYVYASELGE